jgi:hypothetical protein
VRSTAVHSKAVSACCSDTGSASWGSEPSAGGAGSSTERSGGGTIGGLSEDRSDGKSIRTSGEWKKTLAGATRQQPASINMPFRKPSSPSKAAILEYGDSLARAKLSALPLRTIFRCLTAESVKE